MTEAQRAQATTLASKLISAYAERRLKFTEVVNMCHSCVDEKVGVEAFSIFRKSMRK